MKDTSLEIDGLTHLEVRANGLNFHVAECGAGDRLALCLHGFPEYWISWRHQMPLLAELGWRVWAPDLRGYGETDKPAAVADYAIETLMDDVGALIDASGAKEVMLVAHDWGGIIAWYFALRKIRPLTRLVVMNLPHPGAAAPVFRKPQQLLKSWYAFFFQLPVLPEKLIGARGADVVGQGFVGMACHPERFPEEILHLYRQSALRPGALTGMINYYRAFLRGRGQRRQHALGYPVLEVPTLFLWGEQDRALSRATSEGTEPFVRDLTQRYLPNASHWVQQDEPEIVNAMLRAWLQGEPVPQADGAL